MSRRIFAVFTMVLLALFAIPPLPFPPARAIIPIPPQCNGARGGETKKGPTELPL
jgi:hypothetical protein